MLAFPKASLLHVAASSMSVPLRLPIPYSWGLCICTVKLPRSLRDCRWRSRWSDLSFQRVQPETWRGSTLVPRMRALRWNLPRRSRSSSFMFAYDVCKSQQNSQSSVQNYKGRGQDSALSSSLLAMLLTRALGSLSQSRSQSPKSVKRHKRRLHSPVGGTPDSLQWPLLSWR